ncbi:MAG TPA: pilus assembly protein TadG-related protein [Actinomycetota bacterium]|nr:pilus assembly protein TadG-related protein [Actinomycetota bacterium]
MTREQGQATVFVLGMSLVCFAVAGVAVDGTRAFILRRTLQNAADASALAGASELDRGALYSDGRIVLDPTKARSAAARWLTRRGIAAEVAIDVTGDRVRVYVRDRVDATFLTLVGIDVLPVAAEARAAPVAGAPE